MACGTLTPHSPIGFESKYVWKSKGRECQMGTVQPSGEVVQLTGQVARDENEKPVGKGDIEAQTRKCFENIQDLLNEVGGSLEDVVSITTYFTDRTQLEVIQKVRNEFLATDYEPASSSRFSSRADINCCGSK